MYDIAIIGGGAAGIQAVKEALKHKLKTALIEQSPDTFGGVCLNKGCIPTKLYLTLSQSSPNLEEIFLKKNDTVKYIKETAMNSFTKAGATLLWGKARFEDEHTIRLDTKKVSAQHIVIATGSLPHETIPVDNKKVIFAEDIFSYPQLPNKFLVLGGGSVGLEAGCFLNNLSKEVVIVEKESQILPLFDSALAQRLRIILEKKGITIHTGADLSQYNLAEFDMVLLATGRVPHTQDLNLSASGVNLTDIQGIKTNEQMQTNVQHIYACGDNTSHLMWAYVAEYQARLCVQNIVGQKDRCDYTGIPACVFTIPQVAHVGITETKARNMRLNYRVIRTNFLKYSSSYVYRDKEGFLKVIVDERNTLLGAEIISIHASELISFFSLALRCKLSLDDLKRCIFAHPTLSEIIPSALRE